LPIADWRAFRQVFARNAASMAEFAFPGALPSPCPCHWRWAPRYPGYGTVVVTESNRAANVSQRTERVVRFRYIWDIPKKWRRQIAIDTAHGVPQSFGPRHPRCRPLHHGVH
jgi:hypothetical protein